MEFFVPDGDGQPLPPDVAEEAWIACRRGAETHMGRPSLDRRVYRLRFRHDGDELTATVGATDPYRQREPLLAIIALDNVYVLCTPERGLFRIGDQGLVGVPDAVEVEDFES